MLDPSQARWLLLMHQIPPKPDYFLVKIWRRLQKVGAVAIKNSVYALPKGDQALEDFQWILREITAGGGEASICEANFVDGLLDEQVEALFKAARDADYAAIAEETRELGRRFPLNTKLNGAEREELAAAVARLRRRLAEVIAIDFLDSLGRQTTDGLLAGVEARLAPQASFLQGGPSPSMKDLQARVWVTRKGLHVDRMASAWLVRRFVDPAATFKFVAAKGYRPEKGELRFDMFEAEFTHEADQCTFEVLVERLNLNSPGLRPVAEIVHDIDLKDGKFGRLETAGIERLIAGICTAYKDDESRLSRGYELFDALYESFSRRK